MHCVVDAITDKKLQHYAALGVKQISDTRHPIKFRYHSCRQKGSFYLVTHKGGAATWEKLGNWPAMRPRELLERLPNIMAARAAGDDKAAVIDAFATVGNLLAWYNQRAQVTRTLSLSRKIITQTLLDHIVKPIKPAVRNFKLDCGVLLQSYSTMINQHYLLAFAVKLFFNLTRIYWHVFTTAHFTSPIFFLYSSMLPNPHIANACLIAACFPSSVCG